MCVILSNNTHCDEVNSIECKMWCTGDCPETWPNDKIHEMCVVTFVQYGNSCKYKANKWQIIKALKKRGYNVLHAKLTIGQKLNSYPSHKGHMKETM